MLTGDPVALILVDVDHFKDVNDEHGHERGDAVLKEAAYVMRRSLRSFELVYRLGGDEFLIVLPGANLGNARELAERVREALELARPGGLVITASVGVTSARGTVSFEDLYREVDDALYRAKHAGRTASRCPRTVKAGDATAGHTLRVGGYGSVRLARRQRLGWRPTAVERRDQAQLPPADVAPRARLPADPSVDADELEAERLVQADARVVRQRDAGAGDLEALRAQPREQRLVQLAADAASWCAGST